MMELKPCPFCGNKNLIVNTIDKVPLNDEPDEWEKTHYTVNCPYNDGGCGTTIAWVYDTAEEAVEAWNRRKQLEQREKLIELLEWHYDVSHELTVAGIENLADYLLANGVVVLPCRCEKCEYKDGEDYGDDIWCNLHDTAMAIDGFCSYGKRKGGDE